MANLKLLEVAPISFLKDSYLMFVWQLRGRCGLPQSGCEAGREDGPTGDTYSLDYLGMIESCGGRALRREEP